MSIKCASRVSLLSCLLASPYLGRKPKVRVATKDANILQFKLNSLSYFLISLATKPTSHPHS